MIIKSAEQVICDCLTKLQVTYIELLENSDVEGYTNVVRTLRHYVTNLAYIKSNDFDDDVEIEEDEEEGDFDFPH